ARHVGAAGPEGLVPAPGTQALIQWLPRLRPPGARVAVVSPTYNEHAAAWAEAGHAVRPIAGPEDAGPDDDVLVVVNPNNPDGRRWTAPVLRDAAARLGGPDPLLVADEAFADPDATPTLADGENPRLLALRSFGKFFGLAGLRLGIAVTTPDRARTLRHALGPWCVSGPALAVGAAAYGDGDWIAATRARLAADAARLDGLLTGAGLAVAGGTALFRLAHADDANALAHRLADQGILVRAFPYSGQWVRFGLPGPDADWDRLAAAL
ncbi:MAG: aminotransferase class I/II-fold pyridoxal phosphate-dependent enzyme, partial [Rhodobacterales bacterium]|nr:aminotransferase class I/II-fold pyridoxal phosphate-dependent enzyme [Rhodobacterales bacterium]